MEDPWGARFPRDVSRSLPSVADAHPDPLHQARARVKDPVVPAPALKAYRPPFWESKRFGEPYGDFNREPPPRNVVRVARRRLDARTPRRGASPRI